MTIDEVKYQIWHHRSIKCNRVDLQVAADKALVRLPIADIHEAEKLLKSLDKKVKRKRSTIPPELIQRYNDAHKAWFKERFPLTFSDGHYLEPKMPDTGTANGLTQFIIEYLTWQGCRATRISSAGRQVNGIFIPGSTRKGSADISSTIKGKSVMFEIKIGSDKPSPAQLKEQALERKAGGEYLFIKTVEEFFIQYDLVT